MADGRGFRHRIVSRVKSPQNPFLGSGTHNLLASKGFEGMAITPNGKTRYPLLEGPLTTDPDQRRLIINEFDLGTRKHTGRQWLAYSTTTTVRSAPAARRVNQIRTSSSSSSWIDRWPSSIGSSGNTRHRRLSSIAVSSSSGRRASTSRLRLQMAGCFRKPRYSLEVHIGRSCYSKALNHRGCPTFIHTR